LEKYITANDDILPFKFIIDDPAGNSYIKNPFFPNPDPNMKVEKYSRTVEQIVMMGYQPENAESSVAKKEEDMNTAVREKYTQLKADQLIDKFKGVGGIHDIPNVGKYTEKQTEEMLSKIKEVNQKIKYTAHRTDFTKPLEAKEIEDEAVELDTDCPNCHKLGKTRVCTCSIPYFKEIIVIAFTCDFCLHRSTEVKTGGGVSQKGTVYTIKIDKPENLSRDLFKSESAEVEIPEIGCTVVTGSLGGVFSTVEGVLEKMLESLEGDNPFVGDSSDPNYKSNFTAFIDKLKACKEGKMPFTMILRDPLSNCFIQNPNHPQPDPIVTAVEYERTFEENEELGLNDIKTE